MTAKFIPSRIRDVLDTAYDLPTFNVMAYGAVGDGATDDAAAIQSAVNAWLAAGIGLLYFPPKDFHTTQTITAALSADNLGMLHVAGYGARLHFDLPDVTQTPTVGGGGITSSATSLTVSSAAGYPTSGSYVIQIGTEQMYVVAGQGTTTWTIAGRGSNGTTAASHSAGASISFVGRPGMEFTCNGNRWRYFRLEGLKALVETAKVSDAFLLHDSGSAAASGNFWNWVVRDVVVETGSMNGVIVPINNGINAYNMSTSVNCLFQWLIDSCHVIQNTNVTGVGIWAISASGTFGHSSIEIRNPNTYGCLNGVAVGQSGRTVSGAAVIGGTIIGAYKEGMKLYIQGGGSFHTHVEGSWGVAPAGTLEGCELFLQGNGSIIEPDIHLQSATNFTSGSVTTALSKYGVGVYVTGGVTNLQGGYINLSGTGKTVSNVIQKPAGTLCRVTVVGHPFSTGDRVSIYGVVGTTEANGCWTVTKIDADTIDLQGSYFVNAWASGGVQVARPPLYKIFDTSPTVTGKVRLMGVKLPVVDSAAVTTYRGPQVMIDEGLALNWTAVKTANYTAQPQDYVAVDASGGSVTVSLPAKPIHGTMVGVKLVSGDSTHTVAVSATGSDVFDWATGAVTSRTLVMSGQGAIWQYDAPNALWRGVAADLPYTTLDTRYLTGSSRLNDLSSASGNYSMGNNSLTNVATLSVSGLTGSGTTTRYAGGTTSGPPASGTFNLGDFVIDQTGLVWICTTGGSPGTWTPARARDPLAVALGIKGWNFNHAAATTHSAPTQGTIYAAALWLPPGITLTGAVLSCHTIAQGNKPTGFYVGIASDSSGTRTMRAQSNDLSNNSGVPFGTAGGTQLAFNASYTTSASHAPLGLYYITVLQVGGYASAQPTFARGAALTPGTGLLTFATAGTTQTAFPSNSSTITLAVTDTPLPMAVGVY